MESKLKHWPKAALALAVLLGSLLFLHRGWFFRNADWVFWVHVPVLMLHQFEEYGYPGGFKEWWNLHLWESGDEYFPLDWTTSAKVNIAGGWIPYTIMALIGSNWDGALIVIPFIGIMGTFHNAWFHITYSVTDTYSPGTLTSLVLYLPLTSYASYRFYATGQISIWELVLAFVVGGLIHYNLFRTMRRKMEATEDH